MTIREFICKKTLDAQKERLEKLIEMRAPEVIISGTEKIISDLENGKIKIAGDTDVLDNTFEGVEQKKGNGGKIYYVINGAINYFPAARYGRYIKRA